MSAFSNAWYRWKAMRFPWRKRFLVGVDLKGYTYWEFRVSKDSERLRRIVQYPRSVPLSEVQVTAQWHQWLKYMRQDPPTLEEQAQEVGRQERMKILAAQADARWEAKPRVMDAPGRAQGQPVPALNTAQTQPNAPEMTSANDAKTSGEQTSTATAGSDVKTKFGKDPWAKPRGGPSGDWQPEAWTPPSTKQR